MKAIIPAMLASVLLVACNDHRGTPSTNLRAHVIDADSRADVIGASVTAAPGDKKATTDSGGRAAFTALAPGAYRFTVVAAGLALRDSSMGAADDQTATSEEITVPPSDGSTEIDLDIRRFDRDAINLVTLHDGRNPSFTVDNCQACHNDRKHEVSTEPAILPWHALKIHASTACTWCHRTVDLTNHSGGAIRKQVNVAICAGCHPRFPEFPSSL